MSRSRHRGPRHGILPQEDREVEGGTVVAKGPVVPSGNHAQPSGPMRSFVRVLGIRRSTFVEFSFAHGDRELAVELVLPYGAFAELCSHYQVETIESEPAVAQALEELRRRNCP